MKLQKPAKLQISTVEIEDMTDEELEAATAPDKPKAKKPGRPKKAASDMFPVKLLKNYRPASGEREIAGTELDLPKDEAKRAMNLGIAVRNDPV